MVANPIHVRRFAGAIGQVAKTDKLNAQLIAHYGEAIKPSLSQLKPEVMQLMSDLLARRQQLIKLQTMEKNRLKIMPKEILSSIKPILTAIKNQLEKTEQKLLKLIESCPEYKERKDIIKSMPGVGDVMAFSLSWALTGIDPFVLIGINPSDAQ